MTKTSSSRSRRAGAALTFLFASFAARAADAQSAPATPPPPPAVEWKAQTKGGFMMTSGNSSTMNASGALVASRKEGNNKLSLDGSIAYGTSRVYDVTTDDTNPAMPVITGLSRRSVEATNNWLAKARFDRFLTDNNAGYVTALTGGDRVAGKLFTGGGQLGYSRQVIKDERHLLVAELGYDFSYERYLQQPGKDLVPVTIHSARAFVGETFKANQQTGLTASLEALFNLNEEHGAINVDTNTKGVAAFKDTRLVGKLGVSTTVYKSLSMGLGFTLRYDQNPAPRPIPATAPPGSVYGPTVSAFSETVDTLMEATFIYTFF